MKAGHAFSMKSILLTSAFVAIFSLLSSVPAPAQSKKLELFPASGTYRTFQRDYSAQHLAKNPGQKVETILVEIDHSDGGDSTPTYEISVLLKGDDTFYEYAGLFDPRRDDLFILGTDEDDEAGLLQAYADHVLLKLNQGDVITLTARGGQKTFQLKGSDPDHRNFKLYPVQ